MFVLYVVLFVLFAGAFLWVHAQLRVQREARAARAVAVLTAVKAAGAVAPIGDSETNVDAGLPTSLRGSRGIEVAEAHVDIEALLSNMAPGTSARARAQLEEPTNIQPMLSGDWPSTGSQTGAPVTGTLPPKAGAAAHAMQVSPANLASDVPLRNLVLAWYEARGYRPAPAALALRPIEVVLRHRDDPARCYAFVYEPGRATAPRASALLERARSAGVSKLLVAAEHGGDSALRANRMKNVRMLDWPTIDADLKKLDREIADRIVGIARRRSAARAAAR